MNSIERLIYISLPMSPVEHVLLDVMRSSERNNREKCVSGMLMYGDDAYIQLIEGQHKDVRELFDLLQNDIRHRVIGSWTDLVDERALSPSLPMGYTHRNVSPEAANDLGRIGHSMAKMLIEAAMEAYPSHFTNEPAL